MNEAMKRELPWQARQGDVFLMAAPATGPTSEKEQHRHEWKSQPRDGAGRLALQSGTATGHSHAIASPCAKLLRAPIIGDAVLIVEGGGAELVHEEHATIQIPDGRYIVRIQREWSGAISQQVID